ncbi:8-amino-7-oxononanoate synthase [hydrocarbon metagenome]|uniref:8-amino-7-oxononanoate synthase n=1 Tax=hydrocarbon metagenome TaxID=938273 RepID=A0A0W8FUB5_9ZZZZ
MEFIKAYLAKRKNENTLRSLLALDARGPGVIVRQGRKYVDFSSNDYLGLSRHPKLIDASRKALEIYGVGTGASRLLSGDLKLHHILEEETALFKHKESALFFNSGYHANVGVIPVFTGKNDVIFSDSLCHASQIDGAILSRAARFLFRHNDMEHLEDLLKKERSKFEKSLILTESVFSMDGDLAPLKSMVELKDRYDCVLMVDEAHATGVFGNHGRGVVDAEGLSDHVDLIMGTFSKALGGFGAYIAASRLVTDYLINSARSFIYSTALPCSIVAANLAALEVCKNEPWRGPALLDRAQRFRTALGDAGWSVSGDSQIIPVMIGDSKTALNYAKILLEKGFQVLPIRPPTVPEGTSRFRFSLCYEHTEEEVNGVVEAMGELKRYHEKCSDVKLQD